MTPKEYISQIDDSGVAYRMELGNCRKPHNHNDYPGVSVWWRPIKPYCVQDENGNTGLLGYESLQLYDTSTGRALGVVVPNTPDHDNYVPPTDTIVTDRYIMEGYVEDYYFEMETESTDLICSITGTLSLSMDSISIGSSQYSFFVDIESNTSWSVITTDIVSVDKTSGTGNDTIKVTISGHTTEEPRSGAVTVSTLDGSKVCVLEIRQEAFIPTELSISPNLIGVSSGSGTVEVLVNSNKSWEAESTQGLTFSPQNGTAGETTVIVTYPSNPEFSGRTLRGTIATEDLSKELTINQAALIRELSVSPTLVNGSFTGGSFTINVTSNSPWSINAPNDVTVSKEVGVGNDSVQVTYPPNNSYNTRDIYIEFTAGELTERTKIEQSAFVDFLTIDPDTDQNVGYESGQLSVFVESNTNYEVSAPSWITITDLLDLEGNKVGVILNYSENPSVNPRGGQVRFRTEQLEESFIMTQEGSSIQLSVSPTSQPVSKESGSFTVNVISNTEWSAEDDSPWIVVDASGDGNGSFTVNYNENSGINEREGLVIVSAGSLVRYVLVTQAPSHFLELDPTSESVESVGGSFLLSIESNTTWSLYTSTPNVIFSEQFGSGNKEVTVTIPENTSNESRSITIEVETGSGIIKTCIVSQEGEEQQFANIRLAKGTSSFNACSLNPAEGNSYQIDYNGLVSWINATILRNSTGTSLASAGWYSNGQASRYWNGNNFTDTNYC